MSEKLSVFLANEAQEYRMLGKPQTGAMLDRASTRAAALEAEVASLREERDEAVAKYRGGAAYLTAQKQDELEKCNARCARLRDEAESARAPQ